MSRASKELTKSGASETNTAGYPHPKPQPIFFDRHQRRARLVWSVSILVTLAAAIWMLEFFSRVADLHTLPELGGEFQQIQEAAETSELTIRELQSDLITRCGQSAFRSERDYNRVSAYIPNADENALSGARANCSDLQDIYYEAWQLNATSEGILPVSPDSHSYPLSTYRVGWNALNRPNAYPVVQPADEISTQELEDFFLSEESAAFASQLAKIPFTQNEQGLCLDLTHHSSISSAALTSAMKAMKSTVTQHQLQSCLIANALSPSLIEAAAMIDADRILVKISLTDLELGAPEAQLHSVFQSLEQIVSAIPGEKLRLAIATQGISLGSGQRRTRQVSYAEAMFLASTHNATMTFIPDAGLYFIRFVDRDGIFQQIWVPDADTMRGIIANLELEYPLVFWPIGYEDPTLWDLQNNRSDQDANDENAIDLSSFAIFDGSGPFTSSVSSARVGYRSFHVDETTGRPLSSTTNVIPSAHHARFFGAALDENTLSLAFSGLARRSQMEKLTTLLDQLEIPATFFLSFQDQLEAGDTTTALSAMGHQVGVELVPQRSQSVLSSWTSALRNKLVQHFLSHRDGVLARFIMDPSTPPGITTNNAHFSQVQVLQQDGYIMVHPTIFTGIETNQSEEIVDTIYAHALERSTNVVVFDIADVSQDAFESVLPSILAQLTQDGFNFRSLSDLAGITPHDGAPTSALNHFARDDVTYSLMTTSWVGVQGIILILASIVAMRSPVYLTLALFRRKRFPLDMNFHPPMTLVIPAYNEEKVIRRTLQSALNIDYPDLTIIVVDDGSTDATASIVQEIQAKAENIAFVNQQNEGKWSAIDHAIAITKTPLIAILDADSLIDPMALREIVQPFKEERVGGVAGTVEIGNRGGILNVFQRLEYMHTQQVMRRAYEVFDGIIVVPGAMGAWRVEAVKAAGLVSGDTITEDADLTIAVHRSGYSIRYQENAKSFTEAPTRVSDFLKQRLRWTFGMFQASWKHKRSILERKTVGFISIIDAIWYQLITSVIYPFFDIYLIVFLFRLGTSYLIRGDSGDIQISLQISTAYLLLVVFEFLNILAAMFLARRFEIKLLIASPLARFGYRQLLYYASIKSIYAAVMGKLANWNKLKRAGTARLEN